MGLDEIWKDIPNYDGKYQVSNLGRVRTKWRWSTHEPKEKIPQQVILKPNINKNKVYRVTLYNGEKNVKLIAFMHWYCLHLLENAQRVWR